MSEGSVTRDYRGTKGVVDDALGAPDKVTKMTRGRTGVSRSPKTVNDMTKKTGDKGEPSYGPDTSVKPVQKGKSAKRKVAKPDPLKPKKEK